MKVSRSKAKCTKCGLVKSIKKDFRTVHNKRKAPNGSIVCYSYKLSYCRKCLNKQVEQRESTPERYLRHRYTVLKRRCRDRGDIFNITWEAFQIQFERQHGLCFYTDAALKWDLGGRKHNRECLSIDKIIPELGYTLGNFVFCSYRINTMKSDCTLEEMKKWMPDWYARIMKKMEEDAQCKRATNVLVVANTIPSLVGSA